MITVAAVNPTATTLRALSNQLWEPSDELLVTIEPGSEGDVALRATREAGVFGELKLRLIDRPVGGVTSWDSVVACIRSAQNDWVWTLPAGAVPAPRALETLRPYPTEPGAKVHIFRAFGPGNVLMPPYDGKSGLFGPRTITASCALVPRGLAQLATFGDEDWGDAYWLAEMHRLHVAGDDGFVWHNSLISTRDTERPIRERRGKAGMKIEIPKGAVPFTSRIHGWSIFPALDATPDPVGTVVVNDDSETSFIYLKPEWQGRGLYLPMIQFLLEARAGEATRVRVSEVTEGERVALEGAGFSIGKDGIATHPGLCERW